VCPSVDADWLKEAIQQIKSVQAFDLTFPAGALKANLRAGTLVAEFTLRDVDGTTIEGSKRAGVGVDGPRYVWGPFTYAIPKENAETRSPLLPKTPSMTAGTRIELRMKRR
jgi:hypothetical protein